MMTFLDRNIKEVINEYPDVQKILDEYNIGCASCGLGTCLLRDIIEIHNLSVADEAALMRRIARIVYPGRPMEIPRITRKSGQSSRGSYSPPLKKLVDEHTHIKKLIASVPWIIRELDNDLHKGAGIVKESLEFIRQYADRFHHAKEEKVLFSYFDGSLQIITTMLKEHEEARSHVRSIADALDNGRLKSVKEHLEAYASLLTEHIRKEDEILYPWMDRCLSLSQVGNLFSEFMKIDREFGDGIKGYEEFVNNLAPLVRV
ncbi:MAG: hemerythrin domain-containing protein [Spirochaetota bacterium]